MLTSSTRIIVKKLLLFLLLLTTNIVHGVIEVGAIQEILKNIDDLAITDYLANITKEQEINAAVPKLVNELINVFGEHIPLTNPSPIESIAEVVETIIAHVACVASPQFLVYKKFFNYLICSGCGKISYNFRAAYPTTGLDKKNLGAFYAALIVNYHIFIEDNTVEKILPSNLAKSIIGDNKLYNIEFNKFTRGVIGRSAEKIHIKFRSVKKDDLSYGRNLSAHWETVIAPVLEEIDRLISKGLNHKKNDQDSRHSSQQKKMAIVTFVALGALGCSTYYISEKTEQGKELKKWARENPKKAAAIGSLLALIVGKAAFTSFASLINQ